MARVVFAVVCIAVLAADRAASAADDGGNIGDIGGYVEAEVQTFPRSPLFKRQSDQRAQPSVAVKLDLEHDLDERNKLQASLFGRYDQVDSRRSKVDAREATWTYYGDDVELSAGFLKEFWGRLEQENLVDIINQRDVVEDFKLDAKMGQPGARLSFPFEFGRFDAYLLTYFRERPFPGRAGRYQLSLPTTDRVDYESSFQQWHPDAAGRVQFFFDDVELAVGHFYGTSREPRFLPVLNSNFQVTKLKPQYDLINQTSLEAQTVKFGTVWKAETFYRWGYRDNFFALGVGLEHEFVRVFDTKASLTPYLEYYYDDRKNTEPLVPFQNDVFVGLRLALNDFNDTVLQMQTSIDYDEGGVLFTLKGETRIADNWSLIATLDMISNARTDPALTTFRHDDRFMTQIRRNF